MSRRGPVKQFVAVVVGLGLLAGCAATRETCGAEAAQEGVAGYQLGPGDVVHVNVFRQADLSGRFRLDGDGDLALPLAGSTVTAEALAR